MIENESIKAFLLNTFQHQAMVQKFVNTICDTAKTNVESHDQDKISFCNNLTASDKVAADSATEVWKVVGFKVHRSDDCPTQSHHHKENIRDLSDFIEMICDWVAANLIRSPLYRDIEDSMDLALDSWSKTIASLNWERILSITIKELLAPLYEK